MRWYAHAPRRIVTSLVEERLARRHKKGIYLIKRAIETVKSKGDGDGWYIRASTVVLAAAREELRKALAVIHQDSPCEGLGGRRRGGAMGGEAGEGSGGVGGYEVQGEALRDALEVSWLLCGAVSEAAPRKEVGGIKLVSPPR
ncbi:hypothetical protein PYWP30_02027 [Pyrobaculum sp. WP30]|nr:hypothetical protein PYWP30_02027 [Pyrobaculum sp. WP30]